MNSKRQMRQQGDEERTADVGLHAPQQQQQQHNQAPRGGTEQITSFQECCRSVAEREERMELTTTSTLLLSHTILQQLQVLHHSNVNRERYGTE